MDDVAGIYAREAPSLDRYVQVGYAQGKVLRVSFPPNPDDDASSEHPLLDRLVDYLGGTEDDFADVEVALTLPTDQRAVLQAVRELPYGESVDVAALARMTPGLDDEADEDRATVREALAANPAPAVIPDHRVRDGPSAAPGDVAEHLRQVEGL
jgi:methylated-DNA-[protein]-cysteine S-methyltransferase